MLRLVAKGAKLRCAEGKTPTQLRVSRSTYVVDSCAIANVEDHKVGENIDHFGACTCMQNPDVQSASSIAGTLTPMPCKPPAFSTWTPGAKFIYQEVDGRSVRALTNDSKCNCGYGPEIEIVDPATDLTVDAGSSG